MLQRIAAAKIFLAHRARNQFPATLTPIFQRSCRAAAYMRRADAVPEHIRSRGSDFVAVITSASPDMVEQLA